MAEDQKPPPEKKEAPEPPAPNIQFVGKKLAKNEAGKQELVPGDPAPYVILAGKKYKMPKPDEQTEGFFHEAAPKIIRALPDVYKRPVKKGEK